MVKISSLTVKVCYAASLISILLLYSLSVFELLTVPELKYAFSILSVVLILLVKRLLDGDTFIVVVKISTRLRNVIYMLLLFCALFLVADSLFVLTYYSTLPIITLRVIFFSFILGYLCLSFSDSVCALSDIEVFLTSFSLSYFLTSVTTIFFSFLGLGGRASYIFLSVVVLALMGLFLLKKWHHKVSPRTLEVNVFSILTFAILFLFFLIPFACIFPEKGLYPGYSDPIYHYGASIRLLHNFEMYIRSALSQYMFAHAYYAIFMFDVKDPIVPVTLLASLAFIINIAFYSMSKAYLRNTRLSLLATIIFTLFRGYSWLWCVFCAPETISHLATLEISAYKLLSVGGCIPILGFTPDIIAFTLFFIGLNLLGKQGLTGKFKNIMFLTLVLSVYFSHIFEGIFLACLALLIVFISSEERNDVLPSVCCFFFLIFITNMLLHSLTLAFTAIVGMVLSIFTFALRKKLRTKTIRLKEMFEDHAYSIASLILLLYLISAVILFDSLDKFSPSYFCNNMYAVPWYAWLPATGVTGLLAVLGIYIYLSGKIPYIKKLSTFAYMTLLAFVIGKLVSLSNTYIVSTYYEMRLLVPFAIGFIPFAALGLITMWKFIRKNVAKPYFRQLFGIVFLVTILLLSTLSTYQRVEYWIIASEHSLQPSKTEICAIMHLRDLFNRDRYSSLLTVTDQSFWFTSLSGPPHSFVSRSILWDTSSPEVVTSALSSPGGTYVYLHNRDLTYIERYCGHGYLAHLLRLLEPIYSAENENIAIYKIPRLHQICYDSDVALVIPSTSVPNIFYAYDIMSFSNVSYTTVLEESISELMSKRVVVSPIDPPNTSFTDSFDNLHLFNKNWNIITGKWSLENGCLSASSPKMGVILTDIISQYVFLSVEIMPITPVEGKSFYVGFIIYQTENDFMYIGLHFNADDHRIYIWPFRLANGRPCYDFFKVCWPGIDTHIVWQLNETYKFSMIMYKNTIEVSVGNCSYRLLCNQVYLGKVGLFIIRLRKVLFDNFQAINHTPRLDYIKFASEGGMAIIMNLLGYGSFSHLMFSFSGRESIADKVIIGNEVREIKSVKVPDIRIKSEHIMVTAWYITRTGGKVPFISKLPIGLGEIVYVNIFPLIKDEENVKSSLHIMSAEIKHLLKEYTCSELSSVEVPDCHASEIIIPGNVTVLSTSILLSTPNAHIEFRSNEATIALEGELIILSLHSNSSIEVHTCSIDVEGGLGFYSNLLSANNSVTLLSDTLVCTAFIFRGNSTYSRFFRLKNVSIYVCSRDSNISFMARSPQIVASGSIVFKNVIIFSDTLKRSLRVTSGRDLHIHGELSMLIIHSSAKYKRIKFNNLEGYSRQHLKLLEFDIPRHSIMHCIVLVSVFLFFAFLRRYEKQRTIIALAGRNHL